MCISLPPHPSALSPATSIAALMVACKLLLLLLKAALRVMSLLLKHFLAYAPASFVWSLTVRTGYKFFPACVRISVLRQSLAALPERGISPSAHEVPDDEEHQAPTQEHISICPLQEQRLEFCALWVHLHPQAHCKITQSCKTYFVRVAGRILMALMVSK